jgi:hypothetical protein
MTESQKVHWHCVEIMGDQNALLLRRHPQHFWIRYGMQSLFFGDLRWTPRLRQPVNPLFAVR